MRAKLRIRVNIGFITGGLSTLLYAFTSLVEEEKNIRKNNFRQMAC